MKNFLQRITAILCAAAMLISMMLDVAIAEGEIIEFSPNQAIKAGQETKVHLALDQEYIIKLDVERAQTIRFTVTGFDVRLKIYKGNTNAQQVAGYQGQNHALSREWEAAVGTYTLVFSARDEGTAGDFSFAVSELPASNEQADLYMDSEINEPDAQETSDPVQPEIPETIGSIEAPVIQQSSETELVAEEAVDANPLSDEDALVAQEQITALEESADIEPQQPAEKEEPEATQPETPANEAAKEEIETLDVEIPAPSDQEPQAESDSEEINREENAVVEVVNEESEGEDTPAPAAELPQEQAMDTSEMTSDEEIGRKEINNNEVIEAEKENQEELHETTEFNEIQEAEPVETEENEKENAPVEAPEVSGETVENKIQEMTEAQPAQEEIAAPEQTEEAAVVQDIGSEAVPAEPEIEEPAENGVIEETASVLEPIPENEDEQPETETADVIEETEIEQTENENKIEESGDMSSALDEWGIEAQKETTEEQETDAPAAEEQDATTPEMETPINEESIIIIEPESEKSEDSTASNVVEDDSAEEAIISDLTEMEDTATAEIIESDDITAEESAVEEWQELEEPSVLETPDDRESISEKSFAEEAVEENAATEEAAADEESQSAIQEAPTAERLIDDISAEQEILDNETVEAVSSPEQSSVDKPAVDQPISEETVVTEEEFEAADMPVIEEANKEENISETIGTVALDQNTAESELAQEPASEDIPTENETVEAVTTVLTEEELIAAGYMQATIINPNGAALHADSADSDAGAILTTGTILWLLPVDDVWGRVQLNAAQDDLQSGYVLLADMALYLSEQIEEEPIIRTILVTSTLDGVSFITEGTEIELKAELFGFLDTDRYTVQWQYTPDGGETVIDAENGTELIYHYNIDEINVNYGWRLVLTLLPAEEPAQAAL